MRSAREVIAVAAAVLAVSSLSGRAEMPKAVGDGEGQVDIVAWPGYIERGETDKNYDWVTSFEKETGCKVNVKTAATSDEMVTLMNQGGFDLVTASGDASLRIIAGKKVQPVNIDLVPSWKTVDERLQNAPWHTVDGVHYGVPFQWGPNVLAYNTEVFKEAPKSWAVVFQEQSLPDGKSNKGRVQAYDGPIYIADAALYLMKTKPELGIKNPYELNKDQYAAVIALLQAQRALIGRYWHDAMVQVDDFKNEGVVASIVVAVPGQPSRGRQEADRLDRSRGRGDGVGRHHDDARGGQAPELRLQVARAFDQPEAAGRPRLLVRLGSRRADGLQGQRALDRRRLRYERLRQLREDLVLAHADRQVREGRRLHALFAMGQGLHRHPRQVTGKVPSGPARAAGPLS